MARSSALSSTRSKGSIVSLSTTEKGILPAGRGSVCGVGYRAQRFGAEQMEKSKAQVSVAAQAAARSETPLFARPGGVAARFAKLVFEIGDALVELLDFLLLGVNLLLVVVHVRAAVLLLQSLLRVSVVLCLYLAPFPLKNVKLGFGLMESVIRLAEPLAPLALFRLRELVLALATGCLFRLVCGRPWGAFGFCLTHYGHLRGGR